jgi:hypothetical protein
MDVILPQLIVQIHMWGVYNSLKLDSLGNPHISYYDATNKRLKYASRSGTTWTFEIPDTGNVREYTSLALDSLGNPHISYYDNNNCNLKYASKSGGVWHTNTVNSTWTCENYNSLSLDSAKQSTYKLHWRRVC